MSEIFLCGANHELEIEKGLQSYKSRLPVSTHCGLLGVSLLTRTYLAQVKKYTFYGANWSCYMKDTHTLWLTGCLPLTNCKTHLALENVYTVTSLGQTYI